eukprot:scaffold2033_cov164-Amphora_coffeaeformis.AAC.23
MALPINRRTPSVLAPNCRARVEGLQNRPDLNVKLVQWCHLITTREWNPLKGATFGDKRRSSRCQARESRTRPTLGICRCGSRWRRGAEYPTCLQCGT